MSAKRVLSIGQCAADHYRISHTLRDQFGVETVPAATEQEALKLLREQKFSLVLINRILDGIGSSGLEFIPRVRGLENAPPVMLVSNYAEYQQQAEAMGAVQGFGKAELDEETTLELLERYFGEHRGRET
jgi:CheY-like chemotaxis protein